MKPTALLIAAVSIGLLIGFGDRARAACDVVGSPSAFDLLDQYIGRGACTCSALNTICLRQNQGTDPRSINAGKGFCAGSMKQCLRKGMFAYRQYTVTGAERR